MSVVWDCTIATKKQSVPIRKEATIVIVDVVMWVMAVLIVPELAMSSVSMASARAHRIIYVTVSWVGLGAIVASVVAATTIPPALSEWASVISANLGPRVSDVSDVVRAAMVMRPQRLDAIPVSAMDMAIRIW